MLSFEDFQKVDLRVAKILSAERIEESRKLVKLHVDVGPEIGERQIIAGIGKVYDPETLIGRQIIIIANLEPRIMMGIESQGMLLAADSHKSDKIEEGGESEPILLAPDKEVEPGAKIK